MKSLNEEYWDNRYKDNEIQWDLGEVSPPIKAYFDQVENKSLKILIPGGGNSYEAVYLYKIGFKNVYVVDLSQTALDNIKSRVPNFPKAQLIHGNFFDLQMTFDIIVEQTFFCALHPNLRTDYMSKMDELLLPKGKIIGVLFNLPLNDDHPPFGGNLPLYKKLFSMHFKILKMEPCYNSIKKREGKELFFEVIKE